MRAIRIIFLALFVFMSAKLSAQDYSTKGFDYDFYIGTWEYKTPTEQFILKTWKYTHKFSNSKTFTSIIGAYKYIKNGITIHDNLQLYKKDSSSRALISFTIIKDISQEKEKATFLIHYCDPVTNYDTYILPPESILTLESTNPAVLLWHIVPGNGDDGRARLKPGEIAFTIPADMILIKVEE